MCLCVQTSVFEHCSVCQVLPITSSITAFCLFLAELLRLRAPAEKREGKPAMRLKVSKPQSSKQRLLMTPTDLWDHSAMSGLPLRARPGEWFLALLCACQILPVAIHRTSFKGSASERPVRHQSTSEWSGCTNQFSQDRHRRLRRLGHS